MNLDNVQIYGFKANIKSVSDTLNEVNKIKKDNEIIQLLNADAICGKDHIIHGVNQAFLAFDRGENLAKDISVEIVLRCSAQRQISKAFDILGLHEGDMELCAVLINCEDYLIQLSSIFSHDDGVLSPDYDYLKKVYSIDSDEMSIEDMIIDKITKLTVDY